MAATVKTRTQLKYDTEANWNKAINFIPLKGEVIIYSADDSHPFCRLKIGDGINKVRDLPFIISNIPTAEFIISTNTSPSTELTGVLSSTSKITNGKIIYYMTRYALPNEEVTLKLRYASSNSYTASIPIYSYGNVRCVTPYPASYILTLIYYDNAFYIASSNLAIVG